MTRFRGKCFTAVIALTLACSWSPPVSAAEQGVQGALHDGTRSLSTWVLYETGFSSLEKCSNRAWWLEQNYYDIQDTYCQQGSGTTWNLYALMRCGLATSVTGVSLPKPERHRVSTSSPRMRGTQETC